MKVSMVTLLVLLVVTFAFWIGQAEAQHRGGGGRPAVAHPPKGGGRPAAGKVQRPQRQGKGAAKAKAANAKAGMAKAAQKKTEAEGFSPREARREEETHREGEGRKVAGARQEGRKEGAGDRRGQRRAGP